MKNTWLTRALSVGAAVALVAPTTILAAHAAAVHIPDDGFRECLNDHLGHPIDTAPTKTELASIEDLDCDDHLEWPPYRIEDLSGAEHLTGATRINLQDNSVSDLTPLSGLTRLRDLNLRGNDVADVSPLSGLTELRDLNLRGNDVADVSPLSGLTGLRSLILTFNYITDASALSGIVDQFDEQDLELNAQILSFHVLVGETVVMPPLRDASGQPVAAESCFGWTSGEIDCLDQISTTDQGTTFTPPSHGYYELVFRSPGPGGYSLSADITVDRPSDREEIFFFKDNPPGSSFHAPIQWMAAEGISVGYADGTFKKNRNVTRGQTAQFLYRLTDQSTTATQEPFTDVRGAFRDAVAWFAEEEISVGYTDGTFRPSRPVTRGEFAAFLYRMHQPEDFKAPQHSAFTDVNVGGSNWAAIAWLDATGISSGYADGSFKPGRAITRAEVAAFLFRYDQLDR